MTPLLLTGADFIHPVGGILISDRERRPSDDAEATWSTKELHDTPSRPPSSRLPISTTDGGADGCDCLSCQPSSGRRSEGRMAGWGRERPADARIRARARDLQAHRLLITTRDIIFYDRRPPLSPSSTSFPVGRHHFPSSSLFIIRLRSRSLCSVFSIPDWISPSSSPVIARLSSRSPPVVLAVSLAPPIGFTGPAPFPASSLFIIHLRSHSLPSVFPIPDLISPSPSPVLASHRSP
ncbi:hypothetical protein ACLOJK_019537 [Asimina triloba]